MPDAPSTSNRADVTAREQILVSIIRNPDHDGVYLVLSDIGQTVELLPRERISLRHAVRIAADELGLPEVRVDSWTTDYCVYMAADVPNTRYFIDCVVETFNLLEPRSLLSLEPCECSEPEGSAAATDCKGAQQQLARALA